MKQTVYFPNLDGLRFFCFLSVFFFHSYDTKIISIRSNFLYSLIKYNLFRNGDLGVNFFFVLSGFLITFLLLKEKNNNSTINIGNFYLRRILRIWPLYFFCVAFGFLVFPVLKQSFGETPHETANPLYYLFLINNFDSIKHLPDASIIGILWSIAVEEQFYLVWPILIFITPRRFLPYLFYLIIFASLLFRILNYGNVNVLKYHTLSCISDLTVGGLMAYYSFYSKLFLGTIKRLHRFWIASLYLIAIILFLFTKQIFVGHASSFERLFISLIFSMITLEQNYSERSLFKVGNLKTVSYLGQYTYGLYCLHMIAILFTNTVLTIFKLNDTALELIFIQGALSLVASLVIAFLSYRIIEKPFLNLKRRFSVIETKPIVVSVKEQSKSNIPVYNPILSKRKR